MSRAMNLELRELAVSACYAPSTPAGLSHRGTLAESSKNTFLARVALQGLSETSGPKPEGPESCLSPSLRELKPQTACLDLCECGQFLDRSCCVSHLLKLPISRKGSILFEIRALAKITSYIKVRATCEHARICASTKEACS